MLELIADKPTDAGAHPPDAGVDPSDAGADPPDVRADYSPDAEPDPLERDELGAGGANDDEGKKAYYQNLTIGIFYFFRLGC